MWKCTTILASTLLSIASCSAAEPGRASTSHQAAQIKMSPGAVGDEGIRFSCKPDELEKLEFDMDAYLASLGVASLLYVKKIDRAGGMLVYTLNTPADDFDTLNLHARPALQIDDERVTLPTRDRIEKEVRTVSKKEILLAFFQHGRLTEFRDCDIGTLKDHIAIRQNTVAWAENLEWGWPEGESAQWNAKYWKRGTPAPGFPLHEAIHDVFINQDKYSIGCYAATKLVMIQGVLDYFFRIKKDPARLKLVEERLSIDQEPLVDIEPGRMWDFEAAFDPLELKRPGKLLQIQYGVARRNFIPGDWSYFLNTDPVSYQKTGYEGSNAIYLGRNRFDDYYNDNDHSYSFQQKLDEVYQWRNGVFSRSRDFAKIRPLTEQELERLTRPVAEGGIVATFRVFPYFFGIDELPDL